MKMDRETMATPFEGVYATGDVTQIPLVNGLTLPKTVVFAHGQAEVVACNIAAEVRRDRGRWAFGGEGACLLDRGYGKAAYITGNSCTEPNPEVRMRQPSFLWCWVKEGFIRTWLWRWF